MADWRNEQGWRGGEERRRWDQNQNRMRGFSQGPSQGGNEWRDNDRYSQSRFGEDQDDDYQEQDYRAGYASPMNEQGRYGRGSGRFGQGQGPNMGDWRNRGRMSQGMGPGMSQGYGSSEGYGGYSGGGYGYGDDGDYGSWQGRSYLGEARSRFASGQGGSQQGYGRSGEGNRNFWNRASDEVGSWLGDEDAGRRREMDRMHSHAGRGPKGYVRSDDRIREDINDRLTDDWQLDASGIEVVVAVGEVTLTGNVDSREDKRRAEDLVESISGVRNVQNNLRVQQQGQGQGAESQHGMSGSQSRQAGSSSSTGASGSTSDTRSTH